MLFGLVLLALDIVLVLAEQLQLRHATLNSNNPDFTKYQDALLSPAWKNHLGNLMNSEDPTKNQEDSS